MIAANSDSAYYVADSLRAVGIEVVALVDRRGTALGGESAKSLRVVREAAIARVLGTRTVRACEIIETGPKQSRLETIECDHILSAGGHAPAVHLHSQAGGKLRWLHEAAMFVPDGSAPGLWSVGACAGAFNRDTAVSHAADLGRALARGMAPPEPPTSGAGRSLASTYLPKLRGKQFVDLQNDVTARDIGLAANSRGGLAAWSNRSDS